MITILVGVDLIDFSIIDMLPKSPVGFEPARQRYKASQKLIKSTPAKSTRFSYYTR